MPRLRRFLQMLILPMALATTACRPNKAPLESPHSVLGEGYSADKIGAAVRSGLLAKRWNILQEAPGEIVAQVLAGGHSATVRVRYDDSGWSIEYVESSPGLLYEENPKYGVIIHHRYNLWVRNLDQAIRGYVNAPAAGAPPAEAEDDPWSGEPATPAEGAPPTEEAAAPTDATEPPAETPPGV